MLSIWDSFRRYLQDSVRGGLGTPNLRFTQKLKPKQAERLPTERQRTHILTTSVQSLLPQNEKRAW